MLVLSIFNKNRSAIHVITWLSIGFILSMQANITLDPKHFSHIEVETYEARIDQINLSNTKKSKFVRCELSILFAYDALEKHEVKGKILAFIDTAAFGDFKLEDVILFNSVPIAIKNQGNPGEFDLQLFWRTKGFTHQVFLGLEDLTFKAAGNYRAGFFDRMKSSVVNTLDLHLKDDIFAVAMGILLGDKSYLNLELKDAFSGAGAMHLLAVSGLHVGIILPIFLGFFKLFGKYIKRKQAVIIVVGILWIYALMTGFSPSVIRAVFMFSVLALAQIMGRNYNPINTLFFINKILKGVFGLLHWLFGIIFMISGDE
jgi:competence protein ComEC